MKIEIGKTKYAYYGAMVIILVLVLVSALSGLWGEALAWVYGYAVTWELNKVDGGRDNPLIVVDR